MGLLSWFGIGEKAGPVDADGSKPARAEYINPIEGVEAISFREAFEKFGDPYITKLTQKRLRESGSDVVVEVTGVVSDIDELLAAKIYMVHLRLTEYQDILVTCEFDFRNPDTSFLEDLRKQDLITVRGLFKELHNDFHMMLEKCYAVHENSI